MLEQRLEGIEKSLVTIVDILLEIVKRFPDSAQVVQQPTQQTSTPQQVNPALQGNATGAGVQQTAQQTAQQTTQQTTQQQQQPQQTGAPQELTTEQRDDFLKRINTIMQHPNLGPNFVGQHLQNTYGVNNVSALGAGRIEELVTSLFTAANPVLSGQQ